MSRSTAAKSRQTEQLAPARAHSVLAAAVQVDYTSIGQGIRARPLAHFFLPFSLSLSLSLADRHRELNDRWESSKTETQQLCGR